MEIGRKRRARRPRRERQEDQARRRGSSGDPGPPDERKATDCPRDGRPATRRVRRHLPVGHIGYTRSLKEWPHQLWHALDRGELCPDLVPQLSARPRRRPGPAGAFRVPPQQLTGVWLRRIVGKEMKRRRAIRGCNSDGRFGAIRPRDDASARECRAGQGRRQGRTGRARAEARRGQAAYSPSGARRAEHRYSRARLAAFDDGVRTNQASPHDLLKAALQRRLQITAALRCSFEGRF